MDTLLQDLCCAARTLRKSSGFTSAVILTSALAISSNTAALLLAAIGIYGLLSYSVAQRRHRMGIRLTLGAGLGYLRHGVVSDGMRLPGVGIGLGVLIPLAGSRPLAALLNGVGASDPTTLVCVVVLLGLVSLVEGYLPARRAMRIDPVVALRYE